MDSMVRERDTLAKIRGYDSCLQSTTFSDEVTPQIYNNLIRTVNKNLKVFHRYIGLKKKILGYPKMHHYDIYVPLISEYTRKYTYEQAVDEVLDTVAVFGKEYHDNLEKGLKKEHWVDVFPNKGKTGGAYSAGSYDTPPLMLLNFAENIDSVSTLAHECGHSMHTYFAKNYNTPQESNYTIFVAEIASTVNELLFAHRKLRESENDMEKLSIMDQLLDTYKGTLFRQTLFAEFEKKIHELSDKGTPLTQDVLCDIYMKLKRHYIGRSITPDEQIKYEWMRIPHFYSCFYVYKYATCISAATAIVKRIESEGESYISKYIDFLKCGGSKSPLESLEVAEIDMSRPAFIEDAISEFEKILNEFEALYYKVYGNK
jgi:oligoendopeptidase F